MDPITLFFLATYVAFLGWELWRPGRPLPRVRYWRMKGLAAFATYFVLATALPFATDAFLADHRVIDARGLGTIGGGLVGLVAIELGIYVWHRALHATPLLWRWAHQMHHSSERIDVASAFWFSPVDMVGFTALGSLVLVGLVGVTAEAALIVNMVLHVLTILQHTNVRTPRWLGYWVQRPEQHQLHHARGHHRSNYCDLPLIDLAFGTFENPDRCDAPAGYWDGASSRVGAMLCGRDVSAPPERPEVDPRRADLA